MSKGRGPQKLANSEHVPQATASKRILIDTVPGTVIAANITAAVFVGKGNIIRILPSALMYVTFGAAGMAAVTVNTPVASRLESGTWYKLVATDDFIRANVVATRLEVIEDAEAGGLDV